VKIIKERATNTEYMNTKAGLGEIWLILNELGMLRRGIAK
jgi:hypothetical protein